MVMGLVALLLSLTAHAQGGNTGIGEAYDAHESLSRRLLHLEKKNDAFNLYVNFAGALQAGNEAEGWNAAFRARHLRLEMTGVIHEKLYYRLRHHLERSNAPLSLERFSQATDIMMIGWKFSDQWRLYGGKMCQFWGGYEYDENPLYIYQYSDLLNHMEVFFTGAALAWTPVPTQEFVLNVTNSFTKAYADTYAGEGDLPTATRLPLAYILNWNGSLFDGRLTTRWGGGAITLARDHYSKMLFLGQKLNLERLQWYFDYMGAWEYLDHFLIASADLGALQRKVRYQSFVTKANWQFLPRWNLMGKGMYESVATAGAGTYRQSFGWTGALEFFPMEGQDLRVFLSYTGARRLIGEAPPLTSHRLELGFIYRLKAY